MVSNRMGSRQSSQRMGRTARAAIIVCCAVACTVGATHPAAAADDGQWWYSAYNVDQAHADGFTGKGVKIAVIGDQINPAYPALSGAHLTVDPNPICKGGVVTTDDVGGLAPHDTGVVALLVGNGQGASGIRGVAPDADVTFVGYGNEKCSAPYDPDYPSITLFGTALRQAMKDGAQIVTTSTGVEPAGDDDGKILAEAIAKGIVVVSATPNYVSDVTNGDAPDSLRGVVAVSAVDSNFDLQRDINTGAPVVVPNVTVAAAGVDVSFIGKQAWDIPKVATGSSLAAPIVAGMLALTAQKYPSVGGNQLIQSLIHNTGKDDHPLKYESNTGTGYGGASLTHLLRVDPAQYPNENPLLGKDPRLNGAQYLPTDAQFAAAVSAVSSPAASPMGSAAAQEPSTAGADPMEGVLTGVIIGGVVVLVLIIAGAVVTVVLVTRRRRV